MCVLSVFVSVSVSVSMSVSLPVSEPVSVPVSVCTFIGRVCFVFSSRMYCVRAYGACVGMRKGQGKGNTTPKRP